MSRAESAAGFVVALVLAILGALALLPWSTPCDVGTLCGAGASLIPTRGETWLHRLLRPFRRWHLRIQLRAAESDEAYHEGTLALAPQMRELAAERAAELRVELAVILASCGGDEGDRATIDPPDCRNHPEQCK